jgi:hypothetical protein
MTVGGQARSKQYYSKRHWQFHVVHERKSNNTVTDRGSTRRQHHGVVHTLLLLVRGASSRPSSRNCVAFFCIVLHAPLPYFDSSVALPQTLAAHLAGRYIHFTLIIQERGVIWRMVTSIRNTLHFHSLHLPSPPVLRD